MLQLGPFVFSVEALDGEPAHWRWVATWAGKHASVPLRIAGATLMGVTAVAIGLLIDVAIRVRGFW
jgi:hypothetical protein